VSVISKTNRISNAIKYYTKEEGKVEQYKLRHVPHLCINGLRSAITKTLHNRELYKA